MLDEIYQYDLTVTDRDGDPVAWSLLEAPRGMSIDPMYGKLRWIPAEDQLGPHTVVVQAQDLPRAIRVSASPPATGAHGQPVVALIPGPSAPPEGSAHPPGGGKPRAEYLKELEREELRRALESAGWVIARAGKVLGWTPRQVAYKMKKHGLASPWKG